MDTINIIISSLTTLLGLVGGGIGVFFWKENKRSKQIDNELKEADEWRRLYHEMADEKQKKSQKIGELFREIDKWKERATRAEFETEKLQWHKCVVNGCPNRRPPHDHTDAPTDKYEEQ